MAHNEFVRYVVRTNWVIGDASNFVRTMADLAERGVSPAVVGDRVPGFMVALAGRQPPSRSL